MARSKASLLLFVTAFTAYVLINRMFETKKSCAQLETTREHAQVSPTTRSVVRSALINPMPVVSALPKIVHFVWCSKQFRLNNYLSVLSAVKFLDPERIMFHYENLPAPDTFNYESWFQKIQEDLHMLQLCRIGVSYVCNNTAVRRQYIVDVLRDHGGVYQDETTVWSRDMTSLFQGTEPPAHGCRDRSGYVVASSGTRTVPELESRQVCCASFDTVGEQSEGHCFTIRKRVYPKEFWGRRDNVATVVNVLLYRSGSVPVPTRHDKEVVPNIGHMLWVKGTEVDYLFYISCVSLLFVAKVDRLFIHGDVEPRGRHWLKVKQLLNVHFVRIMLPNVIYNNVIGQRHHMSDVFRVNLMMKYGGIYSDVDVIWTQPLDRELLHYDAVASLDWAHAYFPYPDYMNLGVSLGRRGAPFWAKMRDSMRHFRDKMFGYNGLLMPYKVYEENPGLLLINNSLQVMCFKTSCHPRSGKTEAELVWSRDTFAFHWTWPTPPEFKNQSTLLRYDSVWADIGRNSLSKAGLL